MIGAAVLSRLIAAGHSVTDDSGAPLPPRYHRLFWAWFACGLPALTAVLGIFWLMMARPAIALFS